MTSKRSVFLVGLVAALLLLLAGSRTWVTGSVADAVLQRADVQVGGSSAAPVVTAGALVGAAAVIALLTVGRLPRSVAAVLAALAGVLALYGALHVITDPDATIRDHAAGSTGRTGDAVAHGALTFWPWVGVLGAVLLILTGVLGFVGGRRWSGLSSRYDAPAARKRTVSAWDRLSQGEDPTADDPRGDARGPA
ncbi:Trp biosynthesis-associated membrane protein [Allobranchiibius sp. GilTou73]|uniref:Trp biosynthesis-associated membrane protein n=1 Tax=Allobranchiibius sp. GilTou73 TaxID=2904523 RepID=UPI001F266191|nr:Trp biosynthesis-associated membrane protein [Allobranchiibius sp. GilTou73]UIJ34112.1 Trp biosynthesis-associated membrane protein [Allobranchiibius sp. GilTou73]